jgi:peptide-methionine (S)-S-oxide reductase
VRVVYNPKVVSYQQLLEIFWQAHNPTQGDRQGNDKGTQYRSGLYTFSEQQFQLANESKESFQQVLSQAGFGAITTEILSAPTFYFAEDYHQQYLAKEPNGYCGLGGLGLAF